MDNFIPEKREWKQFEPNLFQNEAVLRSNKPFPTRQSPQLTVSMSIFKKRLPHDPNQAPSQLFFHISFFQNIGDIVNTQLRLNPNKKNETSVIVPKLLCFWKKQRVFPNHPTPSPSPRASTILPAPYASRVHPLRKVDGEENGYARTPSSQSGRETMHVKLVQDNNTTES